MLQINKNSVICPVVLSATWEHVTTLQTYLKTKGVKLVFKGDFATFAVLGVRTIKVPQKCLKSFENMKKLGNVNGCNIAYLLNNQGVRVGETLDTPNAIACAMANYEDIYNSVSYYQLFGETRRFRFELEDRFKSCANNPTLLSYLKMY